MPRIGHNQREFSKIKLLFSFLLPTILPPMQGLTDEVLMPKWYGTVIVGLMMMAVYLTLSIREGKLRERKRLLFYSQTAVMLALIYHLVYALVADIIMKGSPIVKGVFDNSTGFALHTCTLMAMMWQTSLTRGRVIVCAVWMLTMASAVMVFLSGCRTGMVCMAVIILMMIYQEAKRWVKTDALRLWGGIIGGGLLLAVVLYVFSVKQESTGGRRFILERTWELIEERPLTGYGWHGFEREYMLRQADYFRQHPDSPAAWCADEISHPLNEFLYLWVDFGIIAPILLLLLFAIPYCMYHKRRNRMLGMLLSPMTIVLVFSLTSYPFLYPLPWVVMVLAYLVMMRKTISRLKQRYRKTAMVASIGLCAIGLALMIWEMACEHEWAKLNRAVERHYTAAVINRYDKLYSHYHNNPRFLYSYMYAQYRVSRLYEALTTNQQLRQYADTYDMELLAGDTYRHLQQYKDALRHYKNAMWMCPVRFAPLEGMMQAYMENDDSLHADSIARVILSKPVKVPSPQVEEIKREAKEVSEVKG